MARSATPRKARAPASKSRASPSYSSLGMTALEAADRYYEYDDWWNHWVAIDASLSKIRKGRPTGTGRYQESDRPLAEKAFRLFSSNEEPSILAAVHRVEDDAKGASIEAIRKRLCDRVRAMVRGNHEKDAKGRSNRDDSKLASLVRDGYLKLTAFKVPFDTSSPRVEITASMLEFLKINIDENRATGGDAEYVDLRFTKSR